MTKRVPWRVWWYSSTSLPSVAEGGVPTASGLSRLAAVEEDVLREQLAQVIASTGQYTIVHCCAPGVPFGLIRLAGASGIAFDLSQLRRGEEDIVAEAAEAGQGLLIGAVPTGTAPAAAPATGAERASQARISPNDGSTEARDTADRVIRLYQRLGLPLVTLPAQAVITPACGLAGASPAHARAVLTRCREAGSMLAELIEETGGES